MIMDTIPSQDIFENLLELLPVGVFWKDRDRRFLGANRMFLEYYGIEKLDVIIGKTDEDIGWHIDPEPFRKVELRVIENGETVKDEPGQCIVQGKVRKILASKMPLKIDGEIKGLIGYFIDVTESIEERERLSELSQTDELTRLLNRRAYVEISKQYENQYRKDGSDFVLYMIDIDGFRDINNDYGHEYGNLILGDIGKALTAIASDNSVVFRYGGDEFVIIHQYSTEEEIELLEKKIISSIECPRNIDGMNMSIRVSVGHAVFSETNYLSALIEIADRRMYDMKKTHKSK